MRISICSSIAAWLLLPAMAAAGVNVGAAIMIGTGTLDPGASCATLARQSCSGITPITVTVPGPDNIVAVYVDRSWGSAPLQVIGIDFGIQYGSAIDVTEWHSCGALEVATQDWPASGSGISVVWTSAQTGYVVLAGWFRVTTVSGSGPMTFQLGLNPIFNACRVLDPTSRFDDLAWPATGSFDGTPGENPPCVPCRNGQTLLLPTTWYLSWQDNDHGTIRWYQGGNAGLNVNLIDRTSLLLNDTVSPSNTTMLASFEGFTGPVLLASFPRGPAVHSIQNASPGQAATPTLNGRLTNGLCFESTGTVQIEAVDPLVTGATEDFGGDNTFSVVSVRPNPATRSAAISLNLPSAGHTRVALFDAGGRLVRMVADDSLPAGRRTLTWDGRDTLGHRAPAGVYFLKAEFGGSVLEQRIVIVE